ncbi:unnamed protein product [Prunus armeniaca]
MSDEHPRQFLSMPGEAQHKGTEYYDGKTKRYVEFPISIIDILQMMFRTPIICIAAVTGAAQ